MGICHGKVDFNSTIRKSVLSSLLQDNEWDEFLSICKCERYSNNKTFHLNKKDLLYIVISGELIAVISTVNSNSSSSDKPIEVRRYLPGDMIHSFNSSLITSDGYIVHNHTKVEFKVDIPTKAEKTADTTIITSHAFTHLRKHKDKMATIVTIDKVDLKRLIDSPAYSNSFAFKLLYNWKVDDILSGNKFCGGLTSEQLQLLGPLFQFKVIFDGDTIQSSNATYRSILSHVESNENSNKSKQSIKHDPPYLKFVGVILTGSSLSITTASIDDFKQKYGTMSSVTSFRRTSSRLSTTIRNIFNPNRPVRVHDSSVDLTVFGETLSQGYLYGLEYYFLGKEKGFNNIVAIGDCIVGLLTNETLNGIRASDHLMFKLLNHNYNKYMLTLVYEGVPMLSDLSEEERSQVAKNITYRSYQTNEVIYSQSDPGDHLYVVLYGSVRESMILSKKNDVEDNEEECEFFVGEYFGEVSMVTDSQHNSTMTALEPTCLMLISKQTFRGIFDENKAKLAELKIKALGEDVDLEHFLCHPKGYQLFLDFLEKEHASENIQFWYAVDRFDEMHHRLLKQYQLIESDTVNKSSISRNNSSASLRASQGDKEKEISVRSRFGTSLSRRLDQSSSGPKQNNYKALEISFKELHDVCGNILDKFIKDGASLQINIPYKMRVETEKLFHEWTSSNVVNLTSPISVLDDSDKVITNSNNQSSKSNDLLSSKKKYQLANNNSMQTFAAFDLNNFLKIKDIFKKSKKEVYELLNKDTYVRLKCTNEFRDFILSIKPIEKILANRLSSISPTNTSRTKGSKSHRQQSNSNMFSNSNANIETST